MGETLRPEYFDELYRQNPDPWEFATSAYEKAKYADTIGALSHPLYPKALEIGCSIGVLTALLASRCGELLGIDFAEQALEQARERCKHLQNVRFQKMAVPGEFPEGPFDLMVVSEVAYYWSAEDFRRVRDLAAVHQPAGGQLLLVHWTPTEKDHVHTGDQVHEIWGADGRWRAQTGARREKYRIDLLERLSSDGTTAGPG